MTNFPTLPRYLIASQHLVSLATNATLLMHSLTSPALESACASWTLAAIYISEHELCKHYNAHKNVTS